MHASSGWATAERDRFRRRSTTYLLPNRFRPVHKVPGDEIFHFYAGDPVEMLELFPDGTAGVTTLGPNIRAG